MGKGAVDLISLQAFLDSSRHISRIKTDSLFSRSDYSTDGKCSRLAKLHTVARGDMLGMKGVVSNGIPLPGVQVVSAILGNFVRRRPDTRDR